MAYLRIWWCQHWNIPPTDPRADASVHEMETWYLLTTIQATAAKKEKPVKDVAYEEVFGREDDDPHNPQTFAGIFEKLVQEAGGMEALSSEQLDAIEKKARELAARRQAEKK